MTTYCTYKNRNKQKTPWPLVRERTIPTERPPTFVDRGVSRGQRGGSPTVINLFSRLEPLLFFIVCTYL
jgi:hypothetical protein